MPLLVSVLYSIFNVLDNAKCSGKEQRVNQHCKLFLINGRKNNEIETNPKTESEGEHTAADK